MRAEDDALVASVPPGVPGIEQNLDALRQSCGDPKVQEPDGIDSRGIGVRVVRAL